MLGRPWSGGAAENTTLSAKIACWPLSSQAVLLGKTMEQIQMQSRWEEQGHTNLEKMVLIEIFKQGAQAAQEGDN